MEMGDMSSRYSRIVPALGLPTSRVRLSQAEFATIDFHDASHRHQQSSHDRKSSSTDNIISKLWHKGEMWVAVFTTGLLAGLFAYFVEECTAVFSSLKTGYCSRWWWLSRDDCCPDTQFDGGCAAWITWKAQISDSSSSEGRMYMGAWAIYCSFGVLFALVSATLVKYFSPQAGGSGIPEIKAMLGGIVMKRFLGLWTLIIKVMALILSASSGLVVGVEGPLVHIASCSGNVISRLFSKMYYNNSKKMELLSASTAAGISAAFRAPIGGTLFSFEETSSYFNFKTMWRTLLSSLCASLCFKFLHPDQSLVLFEIQYRRPWHLIDLIPTVFLGALCGLLGSIFIKTNMALARFRKQNKWIKEHPILETVIVTLVTLLIAFHNPFTRYATFDVLGDLYGECAGSISSLESTCRIDTSAQTVLQLLFGGLITLLLMILAIGLRIPSGLFVPSLLVGALFGRLMAVILKAIQMANPDNPYFSSCKTDPFCIQPGFYAVVGSAAMLSGATRTTIAVVAIVFEATGALEYLVPIILAVLVSKWVGDGFGHKSIYEEQIALKELPYLDNRIELSSVESIKTAIPSNQSLFVLSETETIQSIQRILANSAHSGFPIVKSGKDMCFITYIQRSYLRHALHKEYSHLPSMTRVSFSRPVFENDPNLLDLSTYVDRLPMQFHSDAPIDRLYEAFRVLGLRYAVIVEEGRLLAVITKKDLVAFMRRHEHDSHS